MRKPTDFTVTMNSYLTSYLPLQRNLSANTIASYCDTFRLLLIFMRDSKNINADRVKLNDITSDTVAEFLTWLETDRHCSISTRNQRLAAIKAFFRYAEVESPKHLLLSQRILQLPYMKEEKSTINYLSTDEMSRILRAPDTTTVYGRRDLCFLSVLYDTGARVSELLTLKVRDIYLEPPAKIILLGKGRKRREVPLLTNTVEILSSYIKEHRLDSADKLDDVIFKNRQGKPLTRAGAGYILKNMHLQQT